MQRLRRRATTHERSAAASSRRERGQSLVEMAFIVPIVAILLLGIYDFSRVFTSLMTVESAAREAADFGSWQSSNWDDAAVPATLAGMEARACIASRNLPDFAGDATSCTNPSISVDLIDEAGASAFDPVALEARSDCELETRTRGTTDLGPCDVSVELQYQFDLIIPLGIDFFGTRLGLPQDVTFTRTSIFPISDFTIDQ